ncbi:MAG: NAD(P)/FAD-dependent oxidoreductase [Candidatus Aenigmarchaeota archaeon]|nr:NAD(P)/FAD-dependent oxidoreductase [Candidatus Aenigmarchaeota archaeon]
MAKVVIIGAGIAGSYAAYLASIEGYDVTVYEKISEDKWYIDPLRGRKCGEGIWQRKLENARLFIDPQDPESCIENSTNQLILGRMSDNGILGELHGDIDPYMFINRAAFEDYYLDLAKTNGAEIRFGEGVEDVDEIKEIHPGAYVLCAWGTSKATKRIVSDDSGICFITGYQHTMTDVNIEALGNAKVLYLSDDPNVIYYYIFPKSDTGLVEANVGVVFKPWKASRGSDNLNRFIDTNPHNVFGNVKIVKGRTFSKLMCSGGPITQDMLTDKFFLPVGDADFLESTISGGGIGHALLSSKLAIEALKEGEPQTAYFSSLENLVARLRLDYSMFDALYPSTADDSVRVNDRFFELAKAEVEHGGYLSLSNIIHTVSEELG